MTTKVKVVHTDIAYDLMKRWYEFDNILRVIYTKEIRKAKTKKEREAIRKRAKEAFDLHDAIWEKELSEYEFEQDEEIINHPKRPSDTL